MSKNFSAPRSAPNPASVTTMSPSLSPARVAISELQPWAMLAKGPPWMNAGVPPSVCTRLGCSASRMRTVIALSAPMSRQRTGSRARVYPMMMLPSRRFRSARSRARQKIAMTSDAAVIMKPSSRGIPPKGPPRPTITLRSARSFMSTARPQVMRRWSSPALLGRNRWLSSMAESSACADVIAWKSPVKWRLMSSIGTTCE